MELSTGGPAFPTLVQTSGPGIDPFTGKPIAAGQVSGTLLMGKTLLDEFAGQAMVALITSGRVVSVGTEDDIIKMTRVAYSLALAMVTQKAELEKQMSAAAEAKRAAQPVETLADLLPKAPNVLLFPSGNGAAPTEEKPHGEEAGPRPPGDQA